MSDLRGFHSGMSVDALMRLWPSTIGVMLRHDMLCVGCPVGPFHSISEASRAHALDEAGLVQALAEAILAGGPSAAATALGDEE